MKKLKSRLTYSNVMVTILAFVVFGGTAYAVGGLAKNSVGTKQLKNGAVTKAKIAKSAQKALSGATGPKGPKGDTGNTGPKGSDASALMMARVNGVPFQVGSSWGAPSGTTAADSKVEDVQMLTPFTTAVKADGFSVALSVPAGVVGCGIPGTCFEIVALNVNGTDALTCVVPFGGIICTSGTASTTIPAGAEVAIRANETLPSTGSFDMQATWHVSPT